MLVRVLPSYAELRCLNARAGDTLHPHRVPIDRKAPKRLAYGIEGNPRIYQSAENHVAGGA